MNGQDTAACLQLPGVETASALVRLGQDKALYLASLRAFAEAHQATPERLLGLSRDAELQALRLLAHALKGEAGNLGISAVESVAGRLDAAIRSQAAGEIGLLAQSLASAVADCVQTLQAHLPADALPISAVACPAPDATTLASALGTLEGHLAERRLEAMDALDRLQDLLAGPEDRDFLAGLRSRMRRLQFGQALELLRQEASRLGWPGTAGS
ncbi:MAG: Hpt domain-containing protein [Methylococcus sp.]|nr:Hpt domain-containing protein [Methylococcus sp.]